MAFIQMQTMEWHEGETKMRTEMHSPDHDNPTVPALSPQLANHLQIAPLICIGTLDSEGRPWTTLWGNGDKGFARPVAEGIIGIRTPVTGQYDPVVEELFGKEASGQVVHQEGTGRMVSGLTIDLETRKRVKMFGRMIGGALTTREDEAADHVEHFAEAQLVLKIEQSLGNCPKYLNKKHIVSALAKPELISDSPHLPQQALDLLEKADLFFISSARQNEDMDSNHRGGPPGFVRVLSNDESGAVVCYPEYSGNRLYQTLGNLNINPLAGICIPDFDAGHMLYLTGKTEILVGKKAAEVLPRSNLAVQNYTDSSPIRCKCASLPRHRGREISIQSCRQVSGIRKAPSNPAGARATTSHTSQPDKTHIYGFSVQILSRECSLTQCRAICHIRPVSTDGYGLQPYARRRSSQHQRRFCAHVHR